MDNKPADRKDQQPPGPPPWDAARELFSGGLLSEPYLPRLADHWLAVLKEVGMSPSPRKQAGELGGLPGRKVSTVKLPDEEVVQLRLAAYEDEKGYDRAEVLDKPLKTDAAIGALLAVLEGGEGPTARGKPDTTRLNAD